MRRGNLSTKVSALFLSLFPMNSVLNNGCGSNQNVYRSSSSEENVNDNSSSFYPDENPDTFYDDYTYLAVPFQNPRWVSKIDKTVRHVQYAENMLGRIDGEWATIYSTNYADGTPYSSIYFSFDGPIADLPNGEHNMVAFLRTGDGRFSCTIGIFRKLSEYYYSSQYWHMVPNEKLMVPIKFDVATNGSSSEFYIENNTNSRDSSDAVTLYVDAIAIYGGE